jgi:protoporphyrinogen oxidase
LVFDKSTIKPISLFKEEAMILAKRIAILGGGPMGLSFAYELSKLGYQVEIFEADDRLGGMTSTFDFEGLNIERFYHFHTTADNDYFSYLKELGIFKNLNWRSTKMGFYVKGNLYKWGSLGALLKFPHLNLYSKLRYMVHIFYSSKILNWKSIDNKNAVSWLQKWLGKESYQLLWYSLLHYKFYGLKNSISAAWIQMRIKRIANSRSVTLKEKLGFLDGSSQLFIDSIEKKLKKNKVIIHKSSPVKKIVINKNTVKKIVLKNGLSADFDYFISTIPIPYIQKIAPDLPKDYLKLLSNIKNVGVVCLILKLKSNFTDYFWLNINDENMDIPGIIEYTNLNPLNQSILYIPYYMPINMEKFKKSDDFFIKQTIGYLKKIKASFDLNDILSIKVNRYRHAQPVCEKNFLKKIPKFKVSNIDNLFIGDTSFYYPEDRGISESIRFAKRMVKLYFV